MKKPTGELVAGPNRRRSVRRDARPGVHISCRKGRPGVGEDVALGVMDMSESGIRLMVKQALPDNQEVEIVVVTAGATELKLGGRVMWSLESVEPGTEWVGVLFDRRIPEATLLGLTCLSEQE